MVGAKLCLACVTEVTVRRNKKIGVEGTVNEFSEANEAHQEEMRREHEKGGGASYRNIGKFVSIGTWGNS